MLARAYLPTHSRPKPTDPLTYLLERCRGRVRVPPRTLHARQPQRRLEGVQPRTQVVARCCCGGFCMHSVLESGKAKPPSIIRRLSVGLSIGRSITPPD